MAISKDRRDRFTADEGDFEIVKPAPKKKQPEKPVKKPAGKSIGTGSKKK